MLISNMDSVRNRVGDRYVKTRYFLHHSIDLDVCILPVRLELPASSVAPVAPSLGASGPIWPDSETGD